MVAPTHHHAALLATIKTKTSARAANRLPCKTAALSLRPRGLLLERSVEPLDLGESHVDVCLFVCLLVGWLVGLFVCLFACLLVCLFACLFVCFFVCLFVVCFFCLLVCLLFVLFCLFRLFVCLNHTWNPVTKTKQKQHIRAKQSMEHKHPSSAYWCGHVSCTYLEITCAIQRVCEALTSQQVHAAPTKFHVEWCGRPTSL